MAESANNISKRRRSQRIRAVLDICLALLATLQMVHQHVPDELHQLGGVLFAVLLVVHVLQHKKYFSLQTRGHRNILRVLGVALMGFILACSVVMVATGLAMSSWVVGSAGAHGTGFARALHLPLVHIAYCAIGIHVGLSVNSVPCSRSCSRLCGVGALIVAVLGIWSFIELNYAGYIFGTVGFEFIDPSKPTLLSFFQNMCVLATFALGGVLLRKLSRFF